jgi:UDP-3-O-[3-hydroxymyristoyl] glucosamine N-acyltransferase
MPRGPFKAGWLAEQTGCELRNADPGLELSDVAPLSLADKHHISFLDNPKYAHALTITKAAAVIVTEGAALTAPAQCALLINPQPYKTYARIAQLFYPLREECPGNISPHAIVDPTAIIAEGCVIESGAVIGPKVKLGKNVRIGPNVTIGPAVEIGDETTIDALVSLSHCIIGKRVRILPGVRIGQDGFGFAMDVSGHIRIPQLGLAIIEDDVEIGANSTIDRGSGPNTVIGKGSIIDNLVQIAHNVVLGEGCVIVSQAGVSGSSKLGNGVVVGGKVGIAGHLKIGAGAQIAGGSGVMRDIEPGARMMGYPATTSRQFFRQIAILNKLAEGKDKG